MDYATLSYLLFCSSAALFALVLSVCIILIATSQGQPLIRRARTEMHFFDPVHGKSIPCPAFTSKPGVDLSVIIPAYNEEERLPPMLDECMEFLEKRASKGQFTYEVIVVIDGGNDRTIDVAGKYCEKYGADKFRVLDLEFNRGKGGAIRLGLMSCRGALVLYADADGATKFADLSKLESSLAEVIKTDYLKDSRTASEKLAIAIGSRAHLEEAAIASRSFFRTVLMHGFHFLVWLFAVRGIKDTQCGFKLFTRRAAFACFQSMHVERWSFDVELLYIAQSLNIPITEVAVNWTEIEGSKLTPVWSWIQMGADLFIIWLRYTIGAWKVQPIKRD